MNQEAITKVMEQGNSRVKLLLSLLSKGLQLDSIVNMRVTDLGDLKDINGELGVIRDHLNNLGTEGIKQGILFPSKASPKEPIKRENARQAIQGAAKKAGVTLSDLQLGLTWSANKAAPVIPEVKTLEELMKEIKTIQGVTAVQPKAHHKPA